MNKAIKIGLTIVLVLLLIAVRAFEETLFYDPFLAYFHTDFRNQDFPEFNSLLMYQDLVFRYVLNSIISLGIIAVWFSKKYTIIASLIYLLMLPILLAIYAGFIYTEFSLGFTAGFYIRRLIIQPVLLLILLPSLWYVDGKNTSRLVQ